MQDAIKKTIQQSYSQYLKNRGITARFGQKTMIAEIVRSLANIETDDEQKRKNDAGIIAIEAGTGTGKTVAYSLAAIPWAKAMKKKVVISTATVALQEQIVFKDLPEIQKHAGFAFDFRLAKGRQRYLCLSKLDHQIQTLKGVTAVLPMFELEGTDDAQLLAIFDALLDAYGAGKWDGEKDSLTHKDSEKWWPQLTASHRECSNRNCPYFKNCSFFKARDKMDQADVIVANHDLVLADLAMGGGVILPSPTSTVYIFDEAHHLADKALQHFSAHLNMGQTHQALKSLKSSFEKLKKEMAYQADLTQAMIDVIALVPLLETRLKELSILIQPYQQQLQQGSYRYEFGKLPFELVDHFAKMQPFTVSLLDKLEIINRAIRKALADNDAGTDQAAAEKWFAVIGAITARLEPMHELVMKNAVLDDEKFAPNARWLQEEMDHRGQKSLVFYTSPVQAGQVLKHYIWNECHGAVLTSATLAPAGQWHSFMRDNGLPDWTAVHSVASPFNYQEFAEFHVPSWAEDGGKAELHTQSIIEHFDELVNAKSGGSLFLFSSRKQMNDVMDGLSPAQKQNVALQTDSSKQEVLANHKKLIDAGEHSVLFGLASFAEGIDLPGDYLTHVVIVKLPFAAPDDPVSGTLSEWIESRGGNPFMAVTVPDAAIKLIQASGRLIRTTSDTGRVTLLDNRINTRRYGQFLLNSLPPFKRIY